MVLLVYLVVFFAFTGHSSATYCLCKDGVSEQMLQKTLDYACGAGADCTPINQNGPCFNPNTVKDHCNYAANSYFQKKGQAQGSCDFSGTAAVSSNPPSNAPSSCSFSSSGSSSTPTTGTPTTPTTGTPTTPTTGIPTTPTTGTPTTPTTGTPTTPSTGIPSTTPTMGTPTTPTTGTTTGIPSTTPTTGTNTGTTTGNPMFGGGTTSLGPSGTTTGITDPNHAVSLFTTNIVFTFAISLWVLHVVN
ncbi:PLASMODESMATA CALLOSE-BINDING PROTEIN 3 [Hibiscus syriacus]|uniref:PLASMODESMATA CALLOSE-BINDING PROTEIN 3 n=1 Tax=Hibiscus syriacus TaxID=106335 RepID=A0A6A3CBP0_HIBSY|nr:PLASMODESMATA CALLOSE-BINDING PROTEIN 3-like isoform X1 [Hibiscus syriacus]KAE8724602.1 PLASMODESMATA CALLOSE-BINDING PROTEIN 3 [Hibiscus syriacus]